jgi:preprotein translocase subunit SecA
MTGTASSASAELWSIYGLKVAKIPTNKPSLRQVKKDKIFIDEDDKWQEAVRRITELYKKGQPVLVGTRSVANSDKLSSALTSAGIEHVVLNARQDDEEADIVANAGALATVTVATNMAGRGTDIKLQDGVVELGGLHVLAAEKNESPRIDRQLIGRSGRQGDPGSAETIVALGDDVFQRYCPPLLLSLAKKLTRPGERTVGPWMTRLVVWSTQLAAERRGVAIRKQMLDMDEYLDNTLAFSGQSE